MDAQALESFVNTQDRGVRLRLIDGTVFDVPHRDYVWFTPAYGQPALRAGRLATHFWLHDVRAGETRLVNALLVADAAPLPPDGQARAAGGFA